MKEKEPPNAFLKYSSLGLQLLLVIGAFAWIGLKLDAWMQLKFPAFLLSFILLSFSGMMYKIYRSLNE
ncbi:MAG: AtpZ/AtpI family protein [Bacteroidetes bacterium]|nr:AtpZ/AtpI family protein [Bacteroidota bacterium]